MARASHQMNPQVRSRALSADSRRAVESAISANYEDLTPSQRQVIEQLLTDTRYAAIVRAPELAKEVGVSESTVTRAAQTLGFTGYIDLQAHLRHRFFNDAPECTLTSVPEIKGNPESVVVEVMFEDAKNVRDTVKHLNPESVQAIVDALIRARRVYVFGARGAFALASILESGLRFVLPDARALTQTAGDLEYQLVALEADDVIVVIDFRPADRTTIDVVRYAKNVGAKTVAIVDHLSNPVGRMAELSLLAWAGPSRLTPSYTAGTSLVNALIAATSLQMRKTSRPCLQNAERTW